jgi:hypothetical protein
VRLRNDWFVSEIQGLSRRIESSKQKNASDKRKHVVQLGTSRRPSTPIKLFITFVIILSNDLQDSEMNLRNDWGEAVPLSLLQSWR